MSHSGYKRAQPAFGRLQGAGVAPSRHYQQPVAYAAPQAATATDYRQNPQYAEIMGDSFSNNAYQSGGIASGRPVKGLRFLSGIVDYILLVVFGGIIGALQGFSLETLSGPVLVKFYGTLAIVCFAYGLLMEHYYQGTLGKLATGTIIVNKDGGRMSFGQVLGRNLGKFLSLCVPLYIPYLMVLWTKQNQSLHDIMAGTLVYRKGEIPQPYAETFA